MNIEARIRRNKFAELAGDSYRDRNSQIVVDLNKKGKKALLGIQDSKGIYTVIGKKFVHYSTDSRVEADISHSEFLEVLRKNAFLRGKKGNFEFLNLNNGHSVWISNGPTMNAMWNTVLLLHDNDER